MGMGRMTINQVHLPDKSALDEVSKACKLVELQKDVDGPAEGLHGKTIATEISQASGCMQSSGDVVLGNLFGKLIEPDKAGSSLTGGGNAEPGVELQESTGVPLGSLVRKDFQAVEDACHDFSTIILHRLKSSKEHAATMTSKDATHLLRSYGRCLQAMGEASAAESCHLGHLQEAGGDDAHLCEDLVGPPDHKRVCAI